MSIWSIITDAGNEAMMKAKMHGVQMYRPGHPGEVIREACLKPLGLLVTAAAEGLGVTRKTLSELLNGHSGVSPEMALRLAAAGWSTAETWLEMQLAYDLWQVRNRTGDLHVSSLRRLWRHNVCLGTRPLVFTGLDPVIHGLSQACAIAWIRGSSPRKTSGLDDHLITNTR